MRLKLQNLFCIITIFNACHFSDDSNTYTLYRNSIPGIGENMRIHIATFDSKDGHDYNMRNCQLVQELMQKQDGVKTKFWCEKGKYRE